MSQSLKYFRMRAKCPRVELLAGSQLVFVLQKVCVYGHFKPKKDCSLRVWRISSDYPDCIWQVLAVEYDRHADPIKYYLEYNNPESAAFEITDANREEGVSWMVGMGVGETAGWGQERSE